MHYSLRNEVVLALSYNLKWEAQLTRTSGQDTTFFIRTESHFTHKSSKVVSLSYAHFWEQPSINYQGLPSLSHSLRCGSDDSPPLIPGISLVRSCERELFVINDM